MLSDACSNTETEPEAPAPGPDEPTETESPQAPEVMQPQVSQKCRLNNFHEYINDNSVHPKN